MKALFTLFIFLSLLLHAEPINSSDGVVSWRYYSQDGISLPHIRTLRSTPTERLNGLNYLNTLRTGAELIPYSPNTLLDAAAQNHIDYLIHENDFSHYEPNSGSAYFTGYRPGDRITAANYSWTSYGENLSAGDSDIYEAIDGLFTAIYHRFGFLGFLNNEIGIGSDYDVNYNWKSAYDFDMANQGNWSTTRSLNPQYVLWPHNNYKNAQTSFGNTESPDPVPDCNGTNGNPISIEFNPSKNSAITMNTFKLFKSDGSEIMNTTKLDYAQCSDPHNPDTTDPNCHLENNTTCPDPSDFSKSECHSKFVLFPMQSLNLDSRYQAEFKYTENSTPKTITWSFNTRRYENKRYVATSGNTYDVISGETYLFHLKFANCNTGINSLEPSANASIEHLAPDLFRITATGNTTITFKYNGTPTFTLNLNIAPTDNAIEPSPLTNPAMIPIINYLLF